MSLLKRLGILQVALVFMMIAAVAQLIVGILELIQLYRGE